VSESAFVPMATTTEVPPVMRSRIERPRLIDLLARSEARLLMIKAPAGYGKTTLAVDWSLRLKASGLAVSWLRAEAEHNDPGIFLHYLARAIEAACPGAASTALEMLQERRPAAVYAVIAALVNGIVESGEELCLFIDDYHLLETDEIHCAMRFLYSHAPSHFRLVAATREEPKLPLGSLRAAGELLEIDASQLRFSLEEAGRFFRLESIGLSDAEIHAFQHETGGWAAALRIASTSLRSGASPAEIVRAMRGGGRDIESYLVDVFARFPAALRDFMVRSAVLKSLTPELCNATLAIDDSATILETLHYRYQLIEAESQGEVAFRYHPLIAKYLRRQLRSWPAEDIEALHRRAAVWFEEQGRHPEAIRHAIEAGDFELATSWTEACAMRMIKAGDVREVLSWRNWLPRDLMRRQIPLRLAIGWSLAMAPKRSDVFAWVDEIEADAGGDEREDIIRRECLAIRTVANGLSDAPNAALEYGFAYLQNPLADPWTKNTVGNVICFGHLMAGRHDEVDEMPWYAIEQGDKLRAAPTEIYRLVVRGLSLSRRLQLAEAQACFRQARAVAERNLRPKSSLAATPEVVLAQLAYECNRLDEAERLVASRLDAINAAGFLEIPLRAYATLVRIALCRKDRRRALELLDQGEAVAASEPWPRMRAALLVERVRLYLDQGDAWGVSNALAALDRLAMAAADGEPAIAGRLRAYHAIARASVDMREGRFLAASAVLEPAWQGALEAGDRSFACRLGSLLAAADFKCGERDRAHERLVQVLDWGRRGPLIRTIVDHGLELEPALETTRDRLAAVPDNGRLTEYAERLLAHLRTSDEGGSIAHETCSQARVAPLSPRETDVLELMSTGRSNKRIAAALGVSPETVKSYIKSIFMKLEVDNRTRAVVEGRRLNLVRAD
jgi:LuxR family maltose regulon positive regulatory protein